MNMTIIAPNLKLISFVGVDAKTNQDALAALNMEGVTLEFSVLFSEGRKGGRYSTYEFCRTFLDSNGDFDKSLHLCGQSAINKFLAYDKDIMSLCSKANRIQLNFSIKKHDEEKLIEGVLNAMDLGHHVILQMNKSKAAFIERLAIEMVAVFDVYEDKLSLLYDSSGGFGREIKQVNEPREDYFTGYAGGLKPENVRRVVGMIQAKNVDGLPYYIDMESGIRTDNIFAIAKCEAVIAELL